MKSEFSRGGTKPQTDAFVGTRQGNLLVLERVVFKGWQSVYSCKCDCGNIVNITRSSLKNGVQSCGCLKGGKGKPRKRNLMICKECGNNFLGYSRLLICPVCSLEERNRKAREHRYKIKREVLMAYGGKCNCCGLDDWRFLGIDHINGDGAEERRKLYGSKGGYATAGGGYRFYLELKRRGFPQGRYQVLCYNCNTAKAAFGECPHLTERRKNETKKEL